MDVGSCHGSVLGLLRAFFCLVLCWFPNVFRLCLDRAPVFPPHRSLFLSFIFRTWFYRLKIISFEYISPIAEFVSCTLFFFPKDNEYPESYVHKKKGFWVLL